MNNKLFQPNSLPSLSDEDRKEDERLPFLARRSFVAGVMSGVLAAALPSKAFAQAPWENKPLSPTHHNQHAPVLAPHQSPSSQTYSSQTDLEFWSRPRALKLVRNQTGELCETVYWRDGSIDQNGYRQLCWLFRDLRSNNAVAAIDPRLFDLICAMQAWVSHHGFSKPFRVTSGYRTAQSNSRLEGAARNSMHLYGKAVDIIFPDLPVSYLGRLAQHYAGGGVGFYPDSGFVHVDTGRVRSWGRRQ